MEDLSPIQVFIGYDEREAVAFNVLADSIHLHASKPVKITPIRLSQLKGVFARPREKLQSTAFSFSRFLTPYLSSFAGWSVFMDCDILARRDINELWGLRDSRYAVLCVKHDYRPSQETKFLGEVQTRYEKKNWSSVILFNNSKCTALTPDFVNSATGLELHQFKWLEGDHLIGELPSRWNHLVGHNKYDPDAALVHFTEGGPYFQEFRDTDYANEWFAARDRMLRCDQRSN